MSVLMAPPVGPGTRRYRLLGGVHFGPDPSNPQYQKMYDAQDVENNIIESPTDLTYLNVPGYRPRFEIIPQQGQILPQGSFAFDPSRETIEQFAERMKAMAVQPGAPAIQSAPITPPTSAPVNFDAMSVEQLREHCEEQEIPINGAKTKEQLVAVIRGKRR